MLAGLLRSPDVVVSNRVARGASRFFPSPRRFEPGSALGVLSRYSEDNARDRRERRRGATRRARLATDTSSGTEADETTERQQGGSPELNFYSFNSQSGQNWIKTPIGLNHGVSNAASREEDGFAARVPLPS